MDNDTLFLFNLQFAFDAIHFVRFHIYHVFLNNIWFGCQSDHHLSHCRKVMLIRNQIQQTEATTYQALAELTCNKNNREQKAQGGCCASIFLTIALVAAQLNPLYWSHLTTCARRFSMGKLCPRCHCLDAWAKRGSIEASEFPYIVWFAWPWPSWNQIVTWSTSASDPPFLAKCLIWTQTDSVLQFCLFFVKSVLMVWLVWKINMRYLNAWFILGFRHLHEISHGAKMPRWIHALTNSYTQAQVI